MSNEQDKWIASFNFWKPAAVFEMTETDLFHGFSTVLE